MNIRFSPIPHPITSNPEEFQGRIGEQVNEKYVTTLIDVKYEIIGSHLDITFKDVSMFPDMFLETQIENGVKNMIEQDYGRLMEQVTRSKGYM